jgi:preprotein translocase subunit YajC
VALAILWLGLMVVAFYVLLWRPQQRKMAAVRQLQAHLREGDEIMTTSGIYGRIVSIEGDDLRLEIAPEIIIRVARGAIGQIVHQHGDADAQ